MQIKIPKSAIFPVVAIVVVAGVFWLSDNSNQESTPATTSPKTLGTTDQNQAPPDVREVNVTARQFKFSPNPIRVKLGEVVRLNIVSTDVTHGFSLPAFGINQTLPPGETVTVQFQATQRGEFPFACSIACGSGHSNMRGKLIVE